MVVTYAIVKVYVTEQNATVMSSQYEGRQQSNRLHYFFKQNLRSEIKGVQKKKKKKKESTMSVRGRL